MKSLMKRDDIDALLALARRVQATGDSALVGSECRDVAQAVIALLDEDGIRDEIRLARLALHADDPEIATIMIDNLAHRLGLL